MKTSVLTAVFKRNFFSYFSNPTGYVFICVFVFLSAVAAFWPDEFFNANLANLGQLNKLFPLIMLVFVPAITMSIWADETRQGTDELLLTLPATDFDIVLGKYFAAVAIYTVALLISMASNAAVLSLLGRPDWGLYACTHFGYWMLGLAMLAIGMVASFLTRNLTVAFILGALFNAPLVVIGYVDLVPGSSHSLAAAMRQWSVGGQCQEFGRGMIDLSGIFYFLAIAAIMLYVCMVLIGRRNWARGEDTTAQSGHFVIRALALGAIGAAVVFAVGNHYIRWDATSEQLSSLSPYTVKLVKDMKSDYVEAGKLEPQIAKLEEVVKKQDTDQKKEEAQKKKEADERAAAAKAAEAKSSAVKAADGKAQAAPKTSSDAKPAEAKSSPAKPADPKDSTKNPSVKQPETQAVTKPAPLTDEAKQLAKLREQFDKLKVQGPVRIDAYISTEVPEAYVQTRLNLLSVLREFKALGGDMVELNINDMQHGDPLIEVAKNRYNIVARDVADTVGGNYKRIKIFLGVAFTCGLEKIVLPFIDKGLPAEYELVRSLSTVTRQKRKRIGVLETDAHVSGNFTQMGMSPSWQLIDELKKQYEVVQVSPADLAALGKPGEESKHYDVLLAIQPSAMGQQEMESFVAAIRAGQKAVIFEDPCFLMMSGIPGTYQPRQPQGGMFGGYSPEQQQKGDIGALWRLLGVDFSNGGGDSNEFNPMAGPQPSRSMGSIVWQRYNPYPKFADLPPELVFVDHACGAKDPFRDDDPEKADPISSKLQHMFFPAPGFIEDTPEVVKRLIAKWVNKQYARQLERQMNTIASEFEKYKTQIEKGEMQGNEDKIQELAKRFAAIQDEHDRVAAGGEGDKTIRPDQIGNDASFRSLLKGLSAGSETAAIEELRRDLENRFPFRVAGPGISEDEANRLSEADPGRLSEEADNLAQEATRLESEAAALNGGTGKATSDVAKASQRTAEEKKAMAKVEKRIAETKLALAGVRVSDAIRYAEGVMALQIKDRKFVPLVETSSRSAGTVPVAQMWSFDGGRQTLNSGRSLYYQPSDHQQYVLAAHIEGQLRGVQGPATPLNVVLVADAEVVGDDFFRWREQGRLPGQDVDFDFDNVTFVLNALDSLSGDNRFLELRKRRPQHRTLERFFAHTQAARDKSAEARRDLSAEHDDLVKKAQQDFQAKVKEIEAEAKKQKLGPMETIQWMATEKRNYERKLDEKKTESDQKYNEEVRKIDDDQEAAIQALQNNYKLWAVVVPPIPLLVVASIVFFNRRAKEREGVSSKRLR